LRNSAKLSGWEIAKIGRELNEFGLPKEKVNFEVYRYKVDSIVDASLDALAHLTAVTPEFRELEQIRLEAYRLATYLDYFSVGQLSNYDDAPEVKLEKKQAFYREVATLAEPLLKKIGASDRYLEISDVRNILRECHEIQVFQFALSPAFREWMTVLKNAELLDQGLMLKDYRMYTDFSRQIRNKELRNSFQAKLQERAKLMEGRPAPDIPFKDIDGKEMRLSDFKGKVLYVDFWATWCLPCLFQLPEFEKLSEKYPDIRFIGISIDQNEKLWVKKLKKDGMPAHIQEVLADPYVVGDAWDITSIPRFLLIDENFRIINAFAPRPSDREKIEPLLAR
jgi:thiol-disulfide isomerase/thioredoxin